MCSQFASRSFNSEWNSAPRCEGDRDIHAGVILWLMFLAIGESAVLIEVPSFDIEKVIGVIKAANLGGKKFSVGNMARVEIVGSHMLKNGGMVLELKRAAKREG